MDRWATFDCYGTLVDWRAGIRRELGRLFGGVEADDLLERYYRLEPVAQADGTRAYRDVLAATLAAVAAEIGTSVPAAEEWCLGESLPGWPVFPEVRAELEKARAHGWRLAILSNTDRDFLDASTAAIGIPFDVTIVASEIRSYKPARRHWDVFAAETGAAPGNHVHVAQSLFHDIATAHELGLSTVWINRLAETADPVPTRELHDLTGLAGTLDELVP